MAIILLTGVATGLVEDYDSNAYLPSYTLAGAGPAHVRPLVTCVWVVDHQISLKNGSYDSIPLHAVPRY